MTLLATCGCADSMKKDTMNQAPQTPASSHNRLHYYQPQSADRPWLAKAAGLHGHLGPWVVIGAMIGQNAIERLQTTGQWEIEVICWMPPDKQHPPFTCILDGLQATSGATMGKQNIRLDYDADIVAAGQPVVHVVHKSPAGIADRGVRYDIAAALAAILARSSPNRVEQIARKISAHKPDELFAVQQLDEATLARLKLTTSASQGKPITH